jgi:hypothetical protein
MVAQQRWRHNQLQQLATSNVLNQTYSGLEHNGTTDNTHTNHLGGALEGTISTTEGQPDSELNGSGIRDGPQ